MRRVLVTAALLLAGCNGVDASRGFDQAVRVPGAQLTRASLPADAGGPAITLVEVRAQTVVAGESGHRLSGRAAAGAFAINLAVEGGAAYFTLPVGLEDPAAPGELDWEALVDFGRTLSPGPLTLEVQAVDESGRAGTPMPVHLMVVADVPTGALVVSLAWDSEADVDLMVVDPNGIEIGPKNINSYTPPGPGEPPPPPDAFKSGGILDFDSNAACVIDGRRRENAVWTMTPPSGTYQVRVALYSACGQPSASWRVGVTLEGRDVDAAAGVLFPSDALASAASPPASSGFSVLTFMVP